MKIEEINLSTVYSHLINIIGSQSYILSDCITSIKKVEKTSELSTYINTLAVDAKGTLYISEEFCENYIPDEKALTLFLMHELMHTVLADTKFMETIEKDDPEKQIKLLAANIAFDCRINALLYLLYEKELSVYQNFSSLFIQDGTVKDPINYILFAKNSYVISTDLSLEFYEIYEDYYANGNIKDFYELYLLVLDYLRQNKNNTTGQSVILIGSHGQGEGNEGQAPGQTLTEEQAKAIGQAISDAIQEKALKEEGKDKGKRAGNGDKLAETLIPILEQRPQNTISLEILRRLSISSIAKNIKLAATKRVAKWSTTPVIPQRMAKSDMMSVMMDMDILLWKQKKYTTVYDPTLVPIYFDVSGSMTSYIPKVLELVFMIDAKIDHIWCFSDFVEKHTMKELKERKIRTSGGTSFNAVVKHVEENNFSAILVITDGEGSVTHQTPSCLRDVVTILTPNGYRNNWFSNFASGSTFDLNQITEGKIHDSAV